MVLKIRLAELVWSKGLQRRCSVMQVVAEYRGEQRALRQQQVESREVARCMERLLSQVAAKEHSLDYEVRVVSVKAPLTGWY